MAGLTHPPETAVHRLAPDRIVDRARHNAVERRRDPLVLVRIERILRFDIGIALAVAVGVDHERRPALRPHALVRFTELFCIKATDHAAAAAMPARAPPQRS